MLQNVVLEEMAFYKNHTYHSCLAKIICNPPIENCYMNECKECPGFTPLKEALTKSNGLQWTDIKWKW